jgi:hypothetical protein
MKNYIIYDWLVVAAALNRLSDELYPKYSERYPDGNFLKDVYNNNLPFAMRNLFATLIKIGISLICRF